MIGRPAVRGHVGGGPNWPLYRCVASALGPGPGMPGAPGRPPGWRRRGCRRPPRTGRPATSRRPATRRPRQAGPVRSRQGRLPRPAPRTGAWCSAGRARCTRAGTARVVPARGSGSARLAPYQFSASAARWRNTTPGKVLSRECRGASLLTSPEMSASRASPLRICRAVTVSSAGRPLPGRHITAVKAEPPVAGRPYRRMPAAGQCSAVTPPARHAASLHHELHDARQPICIA